MLSLHREQEAASAYRYEVEKLDLPPGLPPSSQLQGHSGVKADTAGAMLEPARCVGASLSVPSALQASGMGLCGW